MVGAFLSSCCQTQDAQTRRYSTDPSTTTLANSRRALRIALEGHFSDAMHALGATGCASPESVGSLNDLISHHPQNPLPNKVDRDRQPSPLSVDSEAVLFTLKSFRQGCSPGDSCLWAQHLLDATAGSTICF